MPSDKWAAYVEQPKDKWSQYADAPAEQSSGYQRFKDSFLSAIGVTTDEGAKQFFQHPINTFMQSMDAQGDLALKAKDAYNKGDYKGAVLHGINYMLPFIGQNTDKAGEQLQKGDYAGGVGTTLGTAAPLVAPEAKLTAGKTIRAMMPNAEKLYTGALKPSTTLSTAERSAIAQTGLKNEIPVSPAGAEKISSLIDDLNAKIKGTIGSDPNKPINPAQAVKDIGQVKQKFATQVNPIADLAAIDASKKEFLDQFRTGRGKAVSNMTAEQAQAMKQGTYAQLKGKAYGELKGATIEAQKALARGLKEELAKAFPELSSLNAAESKLFNLQPEIERAIGRQANHQLMGIGTPIAAGAAKAVTGSTGMATATAILKAIVDNPNVKSRLAIALNRRGVPRAVAASRISAYSAALASAATSEQNADQANQP